VLVSSTCSFPVPSSPLAIKDPAGCPHAVLAAVLVALARIHNRATQKAAGRRGSRSSSSSLLPLLLFLPTSDRVRPLLTPGYVSKSSLSPCIARITAFLFLDSMEIGEGDICPFLISLRGGHRIGFPCRLLTCLLARSWRKTVLPLARSLEFSTFRARCMRNLFEFSGSLRYPRTRWIWIFLPFASRVLNPSTRIP
jgi:hypothetical protein